MSKRKPRLLVSASTFPLVLGDAEPPFVYELCKRLAPFFRLIVLAPASTGKAGWDRVGQVRVYRYRYAWKGAQRLAYSGGMLPNLRHRPWLLAVVPFFLLAQILAAYRFLCRWRPQVVHSHWLFPQGWAMAVAQMLARADTPLLLTSHGGDLFGLRGPLFDALLRFTLMRSQGASVVSNAMVDALRQRFPAHPCGQVLVRSMGVDTALFAPATQPQLGQRLLFVGRLVEKKGVHVLLAALELLHRRGCRVGLDIVGDGPQRVALEAQSQQLQLGGCVRFLGREPNELLRVRYQAALAVVMPSVVASGGDQEGLGLVAVEAMSCGAIVVASDLPALHDVIDHERNGYLFPAGDVQALSERLRQLVESPEAIGSLRLQARNDAISRFDWPQVALTYKDWIIKHSKPDEGNA
ncbi:Glycogen synthase [Andreprevotia sp. IGB-42]|uniref:glycosyltransferase n=1 Tax=Andreprevotia sp. IGB-42 TaxID=2497473 RepID=UPI00135AEA97|nr:glycosyltransferase [Andreprevotia sp. IGB-42]KAF0811499.1 Glycogen synthase [Andreprevotia sp. IGB-42]